MSRLLPIIALIFAFAVLMLYIRPTFSGPIHEVRQQIDSYDAALVAADRFQEREAELTKERAQIPSDSLARLNAFLPDGVDNVQLILDMDALAARSGMTLSDFDIKGNTQGSTGGPDVSTSGSPSLSLSSNTPIESLNLTFKAVGTYASFRNFMYSMENSLRPLDIIDLKLDKAENGVYSYEVTVRIYWLR